MNYIVFDLEWNQPEQVNKDKAKETKNKEAKNNKSFFEIIEIGAVKLNDNRKIISKFSQLVKPTKYNKLNWHTQKMLKIKMADLNTGKTFPDVMKKFLDWCGESPIFLSWGSQDLTELQENMKYHKMKPLADGPIAYYDVQKIFGRFIGDEDSSKSLENAIDILKLRKDVPFHRAYSDAYYTAKVFEKIDKKFIDTGKTFNLYHLPKSKSKEIHLRQGDEYIHITQGYSDRSEISENRKILAFNCPECMYHPMRPKVRWFSTNSKIYYGAAICSQHGPIKGKLKIKKHLNGLYFAEKVLTYTSNEEINEIKERKASVKKKSTVKEDTEIINKYKSDKK